MHSWKLAVTHLLAAERIGKARQPDLPERPQQIELGLALRLMSLNQRESAALDRHREVKARAQERAEKRAEKRAAERAAQRAAGRPKRTPVRVTQRMTEAAPPGTFPPAPGAPREAFGAAARVAGFDPEDQPDDQREHQPEEQHQAGFIVVPAPVSPEEWDREAKAHHARMAAGEMPTEAERAVWNTRCERAMAVARARGQNGGILRVAYPSPEEMAREAAEWEAEEAAEEADSRPANAGGQEGPAAPPEGPPGSEPGDDP
jgi:hypothetical protein